VKSAITASMCARGRTLAEPRLSPDGTRVAFLANNARRGQIVVVPADGGAELVVTADPPVTPAAAYGGGAFDWTPDSRSLVYASTDGGLYLVDAEGGVPRAVVDPSHGPASAPAVSPDGGRVAFLVDAHHVAVATLEADGPWPVRLSISADFCFDPAWSPDGATVAWQEWDVPNMPWDGSRIVTAPADGTGKPMVMAGGDDISSQQPRYSSRGELAWLSDESGWMNLSVGPADEHEHGSPSWGPGQRSYAWSPDGAKIAFNRNEGGFGRLCLLDVPSGQVTELGKGVHAGLSWVGDRIACIRSGARTPDQVITIDPSSGERTSLARGPVAGFEAALVEPKLVDWKADDGAEVHGRLYSPPGVEKPPLICFLHGGPTGQTSVTFSPRIAWYVANGWAVLVPDYRGSTGWGRAYAQSLHGRWGDLDVEDSAAGMRAAAAQGWCDPDRMVPLGGSAGGFTVLLLLARHPELCAAGVDLFGVADLFDLDETTHRFEAHYLHSIVGPLPETADRYHDHSPINVADSIEAPLLILQGSADKVVPPAQSESIAERLRSLGRTVELHLYEGEGHGWLQPEHVEDELTRTEAFLRRHVLTRRRVTSRD
jgi:dipeptidyl aminopeptidase/acylaminoacyl peptidase